MSSLPDRFECYNTFTRALRPFMVSNIIIAGGGIGGLTLAVALRPRGLHVTCLERNPDLEQGGAGLALSSNAIRELARLGLESAVIAAGKVITRAAILDSRGHPLGAEMDFSRLHRELGVPTVALHRARLHRLLLEAIGDGVVRTNLRVVDFEQCQEKVTALCAGGERIEADLLVGADGLHSTVRAQFIGDGEPVYSGYTSWRGVTPADAVRAPERVSESWGRGERFGIVDIGFGEIYWFACANAPQDGRDRDVHAELLERFSGWHSPIEQIIRATRPERILRADITDRPPIKRWHDGRVVLLGDAAHPMTPNLGQGAGQAIEDAVALDHFLGEPISLEEALRAYEGRRVARANAITRASRHVGCVAQWENRVAVWLRNAGMRCVPGSFRQAQARRLVQPSDATEEHKKIPF
jgi:2-polyprenyl-6-methoxyphenol hydroxylase-like FAD-dependent oxidoreductase